MLTLNHARAESRDRDTKRNRFVLSIGAKVLHLDRQEVEHLLDCAEQCLYEDDRQRKVKRALGPQGRKVARGLGRGVEALFSKTPKTIPAMHLCTDESMGLTPKKKRRR